MAARKRLIITRRLPDAVLERARRDYDARINTEFRPLTGEELASWFGETDAAVITLSEKMTRPVIEALPGRLKVLATFSVGLEHIDLDAAREKGLSVGNAPHGVTIATAEIAMLLILGTARRVPEGEQLIFRNNWTSWEPTFMLGRRLDGKTLGIVGLGKIGQALAKRARAFDMLIHYHNRSRLPAEEERDAVYHASLESLLGAADFVSLNAPSTPDTRELINAKTIAQMKKGAILINTARGDLVEDEALIAALKSGHLAYAGLDVFKGEPNIHPAYRELPNVFIVPHIGSATVEARNQMGFEALDNIDAYFAGRALPYRVV